MRIVVGAPLDGVEQHILREEPVGERIWELLERAGGGGKINLCCVGIRVA